MRSILYFQSQEKIMLHLSVSSQPMQGFFLSFFFFFFNENSVIFGEMWGSLNLISISKPLDIYFAMFSGF